MTRARGADVVRLRFNSRSLNGVMHNVLKMHDVCMHHSYETAQSHLGFTYVG